MTLRFDPSRAIVVDWSRGQMRDDEGTPRINLPAQALLRLCEQAGAEAQKDFAQSLGSEVGRRILDRMGRETSEAPIEAWTEHLGGQLALLGLGDLSMQQWGSALVLTVAGSPSGTATLVGQLLGAALQRALGRQTELVAFEGEVSTAYLVVSEHAASKVTALVRSGAGLGQVVEQLNQGGAA